MERSRNIATAHSPVKPERPQLGLVTEALTDRPLEAVLDWLVRAAPQVRTLEIGCGGYAPALHCDMARLLRDAGARRSWQQSISERGLALCALNAWGNPLHPEAAIRTRHAQDLHDAVRLAALLGVDRLVALAGCPGAVPGDRAPNFAAGGWVPYLEGLYESEWEAVADFWGELGRFAQTEHPSLRICLELHPGTAVYNVETFSRVAALSPAIAATLDPSHCFWMQMDPLRVIDALGGGIAHAHAKDVTFNERSLAVNGLLDHRWPQQPSELPWNFSVAGRGHDAGWWRSLLGALASTSARSLSIEHEDPFVDPQAGIAEAAALLAPGPGVA